MLLAPGSVTALTARGPEGDGDRGPGLLEEHVEQVPEPAEMSRGCQGSAGMPGNCGGETTRGVKSMRCESRLHKLELIRAAALINLVWPCPARRPARGGGGERELLQGIFQQIAPPANARGCGSSRGALSGAHLCPWRSRTPSRRPSPVPAQGSGVPPPASPQH